VRCTKHIRIESPQRKEQSKGAAITQPTVEWYVRESQVGHSNHYPITRNWSRDRSEIAESS